MDFDKIRAFIVLAEELNFRKSAEVLGMSQPPLTRLIANLEKELDVQLFERNTRKVNLTAAGIVFYREAKEIQSALKRIETDVKAAHKMKTSKLKIGFSRTAFLARFPEIVEDFKTRFPKVELDLKEGLSRDILKGVQSGKFDCGFVEGVSEFENLENHQVDYQSLGVLLPVKHPLAKKKMIEFQELKNETLILHHKSEAAEFYKMVTDLIKDMSKKPKIYIKQDQETCPILVATGKGVSLTIAGTANIAPQHTRFVPIAGLFLPVKVFSKKEGVSPSLQIFMSFVIENKVLVESDTKCLYIF